MLFLLLAVIFNSGEAIIVRYSEKNLHNRYAVTLINYIVAVVISFVFIQDKSLLFTTFNDKFTLPLGILNGILFVIWFVLFQLSIKNNGPALSATFTKLGILLPTVGSIVFLSEEPRLVQIIGIVLVIVAIIVFNLPDRSKHIELKPKKNVYSLLLIGVLVVGGITDFNSKIFETFGDANANNIFLFFTFLVALICSIVLFCFSNRKINKSDVFFGVMLGIPNLLTTMFLLWALTQVPAFMVFPIYSLGVILMVSITNSLIFKEKFSPLQLIGLFVVCIALVLLNI